MLAAGEDGGPSVLPVRSRNANTLLVTQASSLYSSFFLIFLVQDCAINLELAWKYQVAQASLKLLTFS